MEQFLAEKSKAQKKQIESALSHLDRFTKDYYKLGGLQVLADLGREKREDKTIIFFSQFLYWMQLDHPEIVIKCGKNYNRTRTFKGLAPRTLRSYTRYLREVLEDCYGLEINERRFRKKVRIPKVEEYDPEPCTKADFRLICEYAETPKRILYMTLKDSGMRIGEACALRVRDIDFSKDPVEIHLSATITKTKKARTTYVTRETAPILHNFVLRKGKDERVFSKNEEIDIAVKAEEQAFRRIRKQIGVDYPHFLERYETNGFHKKNLHAMRAYTATQCAEAVNEDFGHAIIGHKKYLSQYIRNQNKMPELYKRAENHLMIYQTIEIVDTSTELHEMRKEVLELKRLFAQKLKTEQEINELENLSTQNFSK